MKNANHSAIINFSSALFGLVFACALCLNIASCSTDPDTGEIIKPVNKDRKDLSDVDRSFLEFATETSIFEVAIGKLAQKNTTSKEAKELGEMLEADHKKLLVKAVDFGMAYHLVLPEDLNETKQDEYNKLEAKKGQEFDHMFCEIMAEGHQNAIKEFENYLTNGNEAALKGWAEETLPTLKEHLEHAEAFLEKTGTVQ
ncbi:MAG TPA: DUF4142 domain-containing protein [Flavobacteriales bacterium]|nr:DUF4142 domain-containing protein [Flavobacteriales bacterium]